MAFPIIIIIINTRKITLLSFSFSFSVLGLNNSLPSITYYHAKNIEF